jgi:tetratricopeptide (TPR) repeat protein
MLIMKFFKTMTLTAALVSAAAFAQTPYDEGQKALRQQDWTVAAEHFKDAIETDPENADASMYWRAHALYKAGRSKEAERQVHGLERDFPDSRWLKEAQLLVIEHDGAETEKALSGSGSELDEDLRMFALARLMESDPERALPLVMEMIENTDSESVSSDMLFMLGMSDDPEAQKQIARIARDSSNPHLQADAVHMLGIASDASSMELLSELYRETEHGQVKEAVIEAHIVSGEPATLVEILKAEQDPGLQKDIIHALGVMGASADLERIYPTLGDREVRVAALEAFSIAGDTAVLKKILETETDPDMRAAVVQALAVSGDELAVDYLASLYPKASDDEKSAIIQAMLIMDQAKGLIDLLDMEDDPDRKREILQMLSLMESKEANEYLFRMLEKKG